MKTRKSSVVSTCVFKARAGRISRLLAPRLPSQRILLSFAAVILTGSFLLMLPGASTADRPGFLTALFTATSATCVTGLVVVDTGSFWSPFGQVIILFLIQIGGLGYMVITTSMMSAFRNARLRVRQTGDFRESLPAPLTGSPRSFALFIARSVFLCEGVGAVILSVRFMHDMPVRRAVWTGLFTSVSAFCNAGLDVLGNDMHNFIPYVGDVTVNIVVPLLIITGGLGFIVLDELFHKFSRIRVRRLSTHTRIVLATTAILIAGGAAMLFALEFTNPETIAAEPVRTRLFASWFQSVTARTAGFNTISLGSMRSASLIVLIVLMFIGASPGGTGGGVKTTTVAVVLAFVWNILVGSDQTRVGARGIRERTVHKAIVIFMLSLLVVLVGTFILTLLDGERFSGLALLFDATSAFGTVGLSTGITPALSAGSKSTLIAIMLAGRVGVLATMLSLLAPTTAEHDRLIHLAETDIVVG